MTELEKQLDNMNIWLYLIVNKVKAIKNIEVKNENN